MIRFRYNKLTRSYITSLDMLMENKDFVSIKFDTGASNTIITTGALGLDGLQIDRLFNKIQDKNLKGREFTSASSNSFLGYSCYCDGLKMGDIQIKRFYYYIVFNDTSKALLGDDFISCCIFNHGFKNDIIVTSFNFDEYEKQFLHSAGVLDIFEVLSVN